MKFTPQRFAASLLGLAAFSALTGMAQPASAQTIYDPWSNMSYDATDCYSAGYNSCYVDNYGDVYGSSEVAPSTYTYDDYSYYTPLNESNNYYAPSYDSGASSSYVPYSSPSNSHESFINYIWE